MSKIDRRAFLMGSALAVTPMTAFAADDPAGLARSLQAIGALEKTVLPVDPPTEGEPLAQWLLMAAAILILPLALDIFRKRGRKHPAWVEP